MTWQRMAVLVASSAALAGGAAAATTADSLSVRGWQDKSSRKLEEPAPFTDPSSQIQIEPALRQALSRSLGARAAAAPAAARRLVAGRRGSLAKLGASGQPGLPPAGWEVAWHERNRTPVFITGAELAPRAKPATGASLQQATLDFVAAHPAVFALDDPGDELRLQGTVRDRDGREHLTFRQFYGDLPVWGHELVAHFDPNGALYAVNARYGPTPRGLDLTAALSREQGTQIAAADLADRLPIEPLPDWAARLLGYDGPEAGLCVWVDDAAQEPHLAWHVEIRPNLRDRWRCFVDARSGAVLEAYNASPTDGPATATATDLAGIAQQIPVYQQAGQYYLIDASRPIFAAGQTDLLKDPQGVLLTLDAKNRDLTSSTVLAEVSSASNTWSDPAAVSAHYHAGLVFDYYYNAFGRRGIDGQGSTMVSVVHVTYGRRSMGNAYWNGAVLAYGDGDAYFRPLAAALDVAGHEMTHGVIEYTANLDYKSQSGALNESLADVFAVMIDRDDWRLAEDVVKAAAFPSGALRDMADPHNGGDAGDTYWQPATMDEYVHYGLTQDNGGVHLNSGIPNRACYLIAAAVGREKTERIYYHVLEARYLTTQANFVDMRRAAARAAADLYGDASPEVRAVQAAFDAVGIVGDSTSQAPVDRVPVQGEQWVALVDGGPIDHSLYLVRPDFASEADVIHLTETQVMVNSSCPITVASDGSVVFFVDADRFIRAVATDGSGETVVSENGWWSSIALSPDGRRLAATTVFPDSTIYVFDLADPVASKAIHLYNPTTQEGIRTEVTRYADALSWDGSSSLVLYDAFNSIAQASGDSIHYWDVNLLDVDSELIFSVFPAQPEGISLGDPSFARTNDSFVAFDRVDFARRLVEIWTADLFSGVANKVESNGSSAGFPRDSPDDGHLLFARYRGGLPSLRTVALETDKLRAAEPSQAWLGAALHGVWFVVCSGATAVESDEGQSTPAAYRLQPNFPNPFNAATAISFDLPHAGAVRLAVYDLLGREIARLASGPVAAGRHTVRWDGLDRAWRAAASGVYLCQMAVTTADGQAVEQTRKMTLLR